MSRQLLHRATSRAITTFFWCLTLACISIPAWATSDQANDDNRPPTSLEQTLAEHVCSPVKAQSPDPNDDSDLRATIRAAQPIDVILVAYGAPKQELWLDRNLTALDIPVGIGVGGVFNYLSGDVPRAPYALRRLHLEWLHRLLTQPWRWPRQLALPRFAALALAEGVKRRARGGARGRARSYTSGTR